MQHRSVDHVRHRDVFTHIDCMLYYCVVQWLWQRMAWEEGLGTQL